ncbi:MAG TPA: SRPBCC family protein [Rhodocyclaceae bacterium]|nr:SRPBCC family protein [Rhodocyclaceae bacterium]
MIRKIIIRVVAVLAVVVIGILVFAMTQPDTFRVERAASIKAPPEKIYAVLTDFHQSIAWSPYEKLDPGMQRTFSGAPSGKGAVYEWSGNKDVGAGRMEITEVTAPSGIVMSLRFLRPFEAHNTTEFKLQPQGAQGSEMTHVTWSMSGPMPYISKVMCLFFDMDAMIGRDFETGLANLKALTEK